MCRIVANPEFSGELEQYNTTLFYYASHTQQMLVSRWDVGEPQGSLLAEALFLVFAEREGRKETSAMG